MITNFRDIGGVENTEGRKIKKNCFLRSGELSNLSEKIIESLETTYSLRKIIDFRSKEEVAERPDQTVPNTKYIHIDILADIQDEGATMNDFVKIGSPENARKYMKELYKNIAIDTSAQNGYHQFFDQIMLLKNEESLLFHCFAGKDRTGIAAALILETLDVSKEVIYQDYLKTNIARKKENAIIIEQAKQKDMTTENLAALTVALGVDSIYLDTFYQTINAEYGSINDYLENVIGIHPTMKQEMKQRFLIEDT